MSVSSSEVITPYPSYLKPYSDETPGEAPDNEGFNNIINCDTHEEVSI